MVCCSLWGCKESVTTERLNSNNGYFLPYHTVHGVPAARIRSSLPFPSSFTSIRINLHAAAAADLQHALKEFRVESKNVTLCTLEKVSGQVFRQIFSGADFISPVLISPHT